ncbi:unnamed protein product [Ambrosiozyma monospora]|uniref:Unnamed protein product n=1 Tax=Ambrosiozyma monospora TaxID=43982 RepID=A0ACB5T1X1_AMBMO|nr:unnamed protein product [Ambrosiozyma monospora]
MTTYEYTFEWPSSGFNDVFLAGSFDHWTKQHKLIKDPVTGTFSLTLGLPDTKEKILYKFVADGNWLTSDKAKVETDASGNLNNVIDVGGLKPVKKKVEVSNIVDASKAVENEKENVQQNDSNTVSDEKKNVQEREARLADGDKENVQKSQGNTSTTKLAEDDISNTAHNSTQVDNEKFKNVSNTGDNKQSKILRESQKKNIQNVINHTEDVAEKESDQTHEDADTASAFTSISYPQHEDDIDQEQVVSVPSDDAEQVISVSSGEISTRPKQLERETSTDDINSSAQVTLNDNNSVITKNNGDGTLNSTTSTANTAASARNVNSTSGSTPSKSSSILSRFRNLFRC